MFTSFIAQCGLNGIADSNNLGTTFLREVEILELGVHLNKCSADPMIELFRAVAHTCSRSTSISGIIAQILKNIDPFVPERWHICRTMHIFFPLLQDDGLRTR